MVNARVTRLWEPKSRCVTVGDVMNRKFLVSAALGACAAIQPAQATTIDFEALSGTYTSISQGAGTITAVGGTTLSINTTPGASKGILADGGFRPLFRIDFSSLQTSVSVDLGDFNSDPDELYLELFSAGGSSLALTTLLIDASDSVMHTLSATFAGGAAYALFGGRTPSFNGNSIYADNVSFEGGGVPEPATWGMMIAGFALAGSAMRRRKAQVAFG